MIQRERSMLFQIGACSALAAGLMGTGESPGRGASVSVADSVTVTNDLPGSVFFKSLTIFPVDGSGELASGVVFDVLVGPQVRSGDETSLTPRPFESFQFILANQGLKFTFADALLWATDEQLTFHFSILIPEGADFTYDLQFEQVPAPGAVVLGGMACLIGAARRRRG